MYSQLGPLPFVTGGLVGKAIFTVIGGLQLQAEIGLRVGKPGGDHFLSVE